MEPSTFWVLPLLCHPLDLQQVLHIPRYNTQYSTVSTGPLNQPYGWHPLYSSNLQVQISGGIVPNLHVPAMNVKVPPPFSGLQGQSLIDMNPPYVS